MNASAKSRITLDQLRRFTPFDFLTTEYQQQLLDSLSYQKRPAGSELFKRGERSPQLTYLLEGKVTLGSEGARRFLEAGQAESVNALNQEQPQLLPVTASTDVRLFSVDRTLLERLMNWSQSADYGVVSLHGENHAEEAEAQDWLAKLLRTPLFGRLPPQHLHALLARFESVPVKAGDSVIRYGEPGEHFFVIKQGRAAVTLPAAYAQTVCPELQVGDFFGEEALVSDAVRSASVDMLEDGELARLDRQHFVELIRPSLVPEISSAQLKQITLQNQRSIVVLDVRLPLEHRAGHLPGSVSMPVNQLRAQTSELDRHSLYAVTADGGIRSELAVHLLNQLGFEAYLLSDQPGQPPLAA
jgi:CRP-like cAMP-binding protein